MKKYEYEFVRTVCSPFGSPKFMETITKYGEDGWKYIDHKIETITIYGEDGWKYINHKIELHEYKEDENIFLFEREINCEVPEGSRDYRL